MNCIIQLVLNQRFIFRIYVGVILIFFVFGCKTTNINDQKSLSSSANNTQIENRHFSGILVIDPQNNDTVFKRNVQKYFTPASNVKIFTLYMGLKILPEKIPSFRYLKRNDTLYLQGSGDPTLLHPDFESSTAVSFLKSHKNIALHLDNYLGYRFRPGWAWEDYDTYFSPELGSLPLYGNVVTASQKDSVKVIPSHFKPVIFRGNSKKLRNERENRFYLPYTLDTLNIPYITSPDLTATLLEKALGTKVSLTRQFPEGKKETFLGITTDTVYRRMLYESDNFLAEQLVLTASSKVSDTLAFDLAKKHLLKTHLSDMKQEPRWVDGSGLSRYNLFTPESMVQVLSKIYSEFSRERIFHLFPYWDEDGTLAKADEKNSQSFIIAKSGSLGNNYNLSGYLITKSDKILIFSYMNNHFQVPSKDIRNRIYLFLSKLHENY